MTVMISPNPDKQLADVIAVRAAQILLNHGSHVLMREELQASCNTMGVSYLPEKECLQQADVILTIGGDGTILHEANLTLEYKKPILGVNLAAAAFWPPVRWTKWKQSWRRLPGASTRWTAGCCSMRGCWEKTTGKATL